MCVDFIWTFHWHRNQLNAFFLKTNNTVALQMCIRDRIGSLDDDGLLRKSLESICDELAIYAGIESTEEELEEALNILQDFDPAGIGARSLQECLLRCV